MQAMELPREDSFIENSQRGNRGVSGWVGLVATILIADLSSVA